MPSGQWTAPSGAPIFVCENVTVLEINVDCRVDAGRLSAPVRYGLAATLEVAATIRADIHAEIRQQLQVRLRTQNR